MPINDSPDKIMISEENSQITMFQNVDDEMIYIIIILPT